MNCFVIMPFESDFDDVYSAMKSTVESALKQQGTCSRLDELRPAGRITDRLLGELQSASLCLADVTGNRPNVMWELGYATALGKPTILVTQDPSNVPFDIRDLQVIGYDRRHIGRTLGEPLRRTVIDTLANHHFDARNSPRNRERDELVGTLLSEVRSLKSMLADAVKAWAPPPSAAGDKSSNALAFLEGSWSNPVSGSHYYGKIVHGELVMPYCYQGHDQLTGVYFDWRKTGEHWFARFAWLAQPIFGFAFLKQESVDALTGAWWYEHEVGTLPSAPPPKEGVPARWERLKPVEMPTWARDFLDHVHENGLPSGLTRGSE